MLSDNKIKLVEKGKTPHGSRIFAYAGFDDYGMDFRQIHAEDLETFFKEAKDLRYISPRHCAGRTVELSTGTTEISYDILSNLTVQSISTEDAANFNGAKEQFFATWLVVCLTNTENAAGIEAFLKDFKGSEQIKFRPTVTKDLLLAATAFARIEINERALAPGVNFAHFQNLVSLTLSKFESRIASVQCYRSIKYATRLRMLKEDEGFGSPRMKLLGVTRDTSDLSNFLRLFLLDMGSNVRFERSCPFGLFHPIMILKILIWEINKHPLGFSETSIKNESTSLFGVEQAGVLSLSQVIHTYAITTTRASTIMPVAPLQSSLLMPSNAEEERRINDESSRRSSTRPPKKKKNLWKKLFG